MDIHEKIHTGYYSNQVYYFSDMFPGVKKREAGQEKAFADELRRRTKLRKEEFRTDLFNHYNIPLDHPKADLLCEIATDYGDQCDRGNGSLLDVVDCFGSIIRLI